VPELIDGAAGLGFQGLVETENQKEVREHIAGLRMLDGYECKVSKNQRHANAADELDQRPRQLPRSHRAHKEAGQTIRGPAKVCDDQRLEVIAFDDTHSRKRLVHDFVQIGKLAMDATVRFAELAPKNNDRDQANRKK
jgi:hypothetical protein